MLLPLCVRIQQIYNNIPYYDTMFYLEIPRGLHRFIQTSLSSKRNKYDTGHKLNRYIFIVPIWYINILRSISHIKVFLS